MVQNGASADPNLKPSPDPGLRSLGPTEPRPHNPHTRQINVSVIKPSQAHAAAVEAANSAHDRPGALKSASEWFGLDVHAISDLYQVSTAPRGPRLRLGPLLLAPLSSPRPCRQP